MHKALAQKPFSLSLPILHLQPLRVETLRNRIRPDVQGEAPGSPIFVKSGNSDIHPPCPAHPEPRSTTTLAGRTAAGSAVLLLRAHRKAQSYTDARASMHITLQSRTFRPPSREGCPWDRERNKKIPSSNLKQPILEVTAAPKQ